MKRAKSVCCESSVSRRFTPTGKRESGTWQARSIAAAAGWLLTAPLAAQPQIGSTSSASVEISVSVASSFRLKPSEEPARNGAGYCIDTNGEQLFLPVLLVDPSGGQQSAGVASALPWCNAGQEPPHVGAPTQTGLRIVRPE